MSAPQREKVKTNNDNKVAAAQQELCNAINIECNPKLGKADDEALMAESKTLRALRELLGAIVLSRFWNYYTMHTLKDLSLAPKSAEAQSDEANRAKTKACTATKPNTNNSTTTPAVTPVDSGHTSGHTSQDEKEENKDEDAEEEDEEEDEGGDEEDEEGTSRQTDELVVDVVLHLPLPELQALLRQNFAPFSEEDNAGILVRRWPHHHGLQALL